MPGSGSWFSFYSYSLFQQFTVSMDEAHPINPAKFDGVDDCAMLSHLSQASVLHNLKLRYDASVIYTYSGLFLVAINPYKWFPIYTPEVVSRYINKRKTEVPPHVFASADSAYRALLTNNKSQSMLVTGESGAGKTENCKKIIQYLAAVGGKSGSEGSLEKKLLQANPLLEALGNAKTLKNNNSSRFGKFIKITFDHTGYISGSSIVSYLLERSRVVQRGQGERSYHIFYQLISALPPALKTQYKLSDPEDFTYLTQSNCTTVNGMDDVKEFNATKSALDTLGFTKDEQETIFRVCAGILHLGNLKFKGEDQAEVVDEGPIKNAAELWKVDPTFLKQAIIAPRITVGKEKISKGMTPFLAARSRDALTKAIYGRMFLWVVSKINQTLQVKENDKFIGILDIAGFEIFEVNSFEQLCINFTNERLQQFFNNHMFHLEQEEYMKEKIEWTFVNFGVDSQATIDLISKKPRGVLVILDEECVVPKATDQTFVDKLTQIHANRNPKFKKDNLGSKVNFGIDHYAGRVDYDATQWLEKNRDPLQDDIQLCITQSKDPVVVNFFSNFSQQVKGSTKGASFSTVGSVFSQQLDDLLDTLMSTSPHFVRCIIPNHKQVAGVIDDSIVLDQLSCNGVLEGIKISRLGFPNRVTYAEFLKRYYIVDQSVPKTSPDAKGATQKIMQKLVNDGVVDKEKFRFGVTKIFFRTGEMAKVEELREKVVGQLAVEIQACARGFISRKVYERLRQKRQVVEVIKKVIRAFTTLRIDPWWKIFIKSRSPEFQQLAKREQIERELKERLDKLNQELNEAEKQKQHFATEISKMQQDFEGLQVSIQQQSEKISQTQARIEDVYHECKLTNIDIEGARERLREKEKEFKNFKEDESDVVGSIKVTETKLAELTNEVKKVDSQITAEKATGSKIRGEIEQQKAVIEDLNKVRDDLLQKLENKQFDNTLLKEKREQLQADKSSLETGLNASGLNKGQLNNDITILQRKIEALELDHNNTKPIYLQLVEKHRAADVLTKKLEQEIAHVQNEIENETSKAHKLNGDLKSMNAENISLKYDVEDARTKLKEMTDKRQKTTEEFESAVTRLNQTVEEKNTLTNVNQVTTKKVAELRVQLSDANTKFEKLSKEVTTLNEEIEKYKQLHEETVENSSKLEKQIIKLNNDQAELHEKLKNSTGLNAKGTKQASVLEAKIGELNKSITEAKSKKEKELENAKKMNESKEKTRTELESTIAEKENNAKAVQAHKLTITELTHAVDTSKGDITTAEKKIVAVHKLKQEAKDHIELLQRDKSSFTSAMENLEHKLVEVNGKLNEQREQHKRVQTKIKQLESERQEKVSLVESIQKEINSFEKKVASLTSEEKEKRSNLHDLQNKLLEEQKEEDRLNEAIKSEERKLQSILQDTDELQKEVLSAQLRADDFKAKVDAATSLNNDAQRVIKDLQTQINHLKEDIESESKAKWRAKQHVGDVEDAIERKKLELAAAKNQQMVEELMKKLNSDINNTLQDIDAITKSKYDLESDIREVQRQRDSILLSLDGVRADQSNADRDRKSVLHKLHNLNKDLAEINNSNKLLEQKVLAAERKVAKSKGIVQPTTSSSSSSSSTRQRPAKKAKKIVKRVEIQKVLVKVPKAKAEVSEPKPEESEGEVQETGDSPAAEETVEEFEEVEVEKEVEVEEEVDASDDEEQEEQEEEDAVVVQKSSTQPVITPEEKLRDLKDESRKLSNTIKTERRAYSYFEREASSLELEISHLRESLRDAQTKNSNLRRYQHTVQDEVDILKGSLQADEEFSKTVHGLTKENEEVVMKLAADLKNRQSERDLVQQQCSKLQRELVKIHSELKREEFLAEKMRETLYKANNKLSATITDERAGIVNNQDSPLEAKQKDTNLSIRRETQRTLKTIKKLSNYLGNLLVEKDEQDKITWTLQQEAETLREEVHDIYVARTVSEKERETLRKHLMTAEQYSKDVQSEYDKRRVAINERYREIEHFKDKLNEYQDKNSKLDKYKEKYGRVLAHLKHDLETAIARHEVENEEKLNAEFDRKKLRKMVTQVKLEREEFDAENARLEQQLDKLKSEYRLKHTIFTNMEREHEFLLTDLSFMQITEKEPIETESSRLIAQLEATRDQLVSTKAKSNKLREQSLLQEEELEKLRFDVKTLKADLSRMKIRVNQETKAKDQLRDLVDRLEGATEPELEEVL
eukprot:TRINITY_DN380_c0_g1_i3.p1 TRINITY_DN380_c0_g1~~TRINITY_DN380_c0_g1_i3.p1  ORF type:complete len:2192 (-),score=799.53 TRINITY_DN380_c0_g1_i3:42-6617(-)